jgi:hypothetical protein
MGDDDDRIRADLLALRGCERVVRAVPGDADPIAVRLRLLAGVAIQTSAALELGEPRLLTISYDERMVALALEPDGALLAVITRDPTTVGLAMIKLRQWLAGKSGSGA